MTGASGTIVAIGGGGFQMPPDDGRIDAFLLSLARDRAGRDRPRIALIPTAAADDDWVIARFYATFARDAEPSHLALFSRTIEDVDAWILDQDLVFIAGGNTVNMLAIWRRHGVDRGLLGGLEAGVVMTGMSAGGTCWFEGFTTDSFGPALQPVRDGMGVLQGSFVPHYHGEPQRRPLFHSLVADGTLPAGYGVDDGVALVFRDAALAEVVSTSPERGAWHVDVVDREARERRLEARQLPG